jgi:ATP-dependent DNA helicase RecG
VKTENLHKPIDKIKGVGPKVKEDLKKIGINSIQDALFLLPKKYENRTKITEIKDLISGDAFQFEGEILESKTIYPGRRSFLAKISDGTGILQIRLFYFSYAQAQAFKVGLTLRGYGVIRTNGSVTQVFHPSYKIFESSKRPMLDNTLTPIYSLGSSKLTQFRTRNIIKGCLQEIKEINLNEKEIDSIFKEKKISSLSIKDALLKIHAPSVSDDIIKINNYKDEAQERLIIEELATNLIGVKIASEKINKLKAKQMEILKKDLSSFVEKLPFKLTGAQLRTINDISNDLSKVKPMRRLVQGDVGSGKTVVAAVSMYISTKNNSQSVLLCPTEVLAEQHYKNFTEWFENTNIKIELLTGKMSAVIRKDIYQRLEEGKIDILIGTHAVFQDKVKMKNLGLVIVDEQQRFGVKQRFDLVKKSSNKIMPHQLFMTATPIPRTLAMTIFADLDVSKIDEMPPGRKPVETLVFSDKKKNEIVKRLENVCSKGNQVFWLCTMIEESENLDVQAAEEAKIWIKENTSKLNIGLVHSKLSKDERDKAIEKFRSGKIDVLVCTTVIEVGMDVPNASLIVIENAERLGLSQLHQLRGRVGRKADLDAFCVLIYQGEIGEIAKARLEAMKSTNDGFEISEIDMKLRGSGEILGTKQSGGVELKISDLSRDAHLIQKAEKLVDGLKNVDQKMSKVLLDRWIGDKQNLIIAQ